MATIIQDGLLTYSFGGTAVSYACLPIAISDTKNTLLHWAFDNIGDVIQFKIDLMLTPFLRTGVVVIKEQIQSEKKIRKETVHLASEQQIANLEEQQEGNQQDNEMQICPGKLSIRVCNENIVAISRFVAC